MAVLLREREGDSWNESRDPFSESWQVAAFTHRVPAQEKRAAACNNRELIMMFGLSGEEEGRAAIRGRRKERHPRASAEPDRPVLHLLRFWWCSALESPRAQVLAKSASDLSRARGSRKPQKSTLTLAR